MSEEEGAQPYLNLERPDDDALAALESASVRYRIAVGPIAGRKTLRGLSPAFAFLISWIVSIWGYFLAGSILYPQTYPRKGRKGLV